MVAAASKKPSGGLDLARALGAVVLAFSVVTLSGWVFGLAILLQPLPGMKAMVFNSALLFALIGSMLALPQGFSFRLPFAFLVAGTCVLISTAVSSQDVFGVDWGIDQALVTAELPDGNPHPGRMAPNTCLAFILAGVALLLFELRPSRRSVSVIPLLSFAVLTLGATGLAGHTLRLDVVYEWFVYARMSLPSAICFVVLGVAMWAKWQRHPVYWALFRGREDRKVQLLAVGILGMTALTAGIGGLTSTLSENQRTLVRGLALALDESIGNLEHTVESEHAMLRFVAQQDGVRRAMGETGAQSSGSLRKVLRARYRRALLHDENGRLIARSGPDLVPKLAVEFPSWPGSGILFGESLELWFSSDVIGHDGRRARLTAYLPIPHLEAKLRQAHAIGATAALNLCASKDATSLHCFPSRYDPGVSIRPKRHEGQQVAMGRAVSGERGVSEGTWDTRGVHVLAAYRSLDALGLGVVLKVDSKELYRPLASQLARGVPVLLLLVLMGAALLTSQVTPLVRSIVAGQQHASTITRALERSERQTRAILDGVSDGIVTLDEDTVLQTVNPAAMRLLGGTASELVGRKLVDFTARRSAGKAVLRLCQRATRELTSAGAEVAAFDLLRLDGFRVEVEVSIDSVEDRGEPMAVAVIRDVSRQRQVDRLKDEFVATVSHELRTPLTSIRGSLGLVASGVSGPVSDSAKKLVHIALDNCQRLIHLINDILDIEKVAAGKMEFVFRAVEVQGVVSHAVDSVRSHAAQQGIEIVLLSSVAERRVLADEGRLHQAMTNLLSNAIKYSPRGGTVRVVVESRAGLVRVAVTDEGPGVPADFRGRIFSRFAQADSSSSRAKNGTGLGLSITKAIVERHQGTIDYTSELGNGSTFFFELPAVRDNASQEEIQAEAPSGGMHQGLPSVLHVEDDAQSRQVIAAVLAGIANVTGAGTVPEALDELQRSRFDVVLLDLDLPGASGAEVLDHVRRADPEARVVVFTAHDGLIDDAVRAASAAVLIKSRISETELRRRIEELLSPSGRFERPALAHA